MFPNYICEACQVRAHKDRELVQGSTDVVTLMTERQRMLDTMHMWAEGTVQGYTSHFRQLKEFQLTHEVSTLKPRALLKPPTSPAIPVMWTQLLYSARGHKRDPDKAIKYNTARHIRSTASLYYSWDLQVAFPGQATKTKDGCMALPYIIPTAELGYTLQQGGMARRLGTQVKPSRALQHKHVQYVNDRLEQRWQATTDPEVRREIACAGVANLQLWTSWLRGGENFALPRSNVEVHPPETAAQFDLPPGQGFVGFKLTPETKSSPYQQVDLEVTYCTPVSLA